MYETSKKAAKNKQRHNLQAHTYAYSHIYIILYMRALMKTINLSFGRKISRVRVCVRVSLSCYTDIFYSERAVGELLLLLLYFIFFLINISPPHHYHHRLVRAFLPTRYYYTHRHHTHTHTHMYIIQTTPRPYGSSLAYIIITQRRPLPFTRPPRTHNGYFLFSESVSCTPDVMIHIIMKIYYNDSDHLAISYLLFAMS